MVERPIKKADRQPQTENNDGNIAKEAEGKRSDRGGKDSKGRKDRHGKRGDREEVKAPVNLALVRGPKPTQPKPEVVEEVVEEVASEEVVAETEEVTEA